MIVGTPGGAGAEPGPDTSPASGSGQSIECTYKEISVGCVARSYLLAEPLSETLKQQPDFGQNEVSRHALRLKDAPAMAMAWDKTANILYLDLNRNQDLTDDPAGVITNVVGSNRYPTFRDIRLTVPTQGREIPFLLDFSLFPMPVGSRTHINIQVRSFWQGKAVLGAREFEVGLVEQPDTENSRQLVLRSWDRHEEPLSLDDDSLDAVAMPRELFVGGHIYAIESTFDTNAKPVRCRLELRDTVPTVGEVRLTGQYLDRLVLTDDKRAVVLDQPSPVEKVPLGQYTVQGVRLKSGKVTASLAPSPREPGPRIHVSPTDPAVLRMGGPLTNSVSITRRGKSLAFSYELRGGAGAAYQLTGQGPRVQPEFAVYQGDRKVATGKFEFG